MRRGRAAFSCLSGPRHTSQSLLSSHLECLCCACLLPPPIRGFRTVFAPTHRLRI